VREWDGREKGEDGWRRAPAREGSDEWLMRECEDALRAYGEGMATRLPLEANLALVCLESGYTRSAATIADEDWRVVRVVAAAAAARERRRERRQRVD
jgi:hypothetical protein